MVGENDIAFYQNAAISAMQGILENPSKLSMLYDVSPKLVSKLSFEFADAMLEEFRRKMEEHGDVKL